MRAKRACRDTSSAGIEFANSAVLTISKGIIELPWQAGTHLRSCRGSGTVEAGLAFAFDNNAICIACGTVKAHYGLVYKAVATLCRWTCCRTHVTRHATVSYDDCICPTKPAIATIGGDRLMHATVATFRRGAGGRTIRADLTPVVYDY